MRRWTLLALPILRRMRSLLAVSVVLGDRLAVPDREPCCGFLTENWRSTSAVRRFWSGRDEGGTRSDEAADLGAGPAESGVSQNM